MCPPSTDSHPSVLSDDLFDRSGRRSGDAGRTFGHEQQDAIIGISEVREVELPVLRVVEPGDGRLVAGDHHLAEHLESGLHVLQGPAEERVVLG